MTDENVPFDEGNLVASDSTEGRDWESELSIAQQRIDMLERELQQKDFQLDLNGAMARLNVAGQILGGMYGNDMLDMASHASVADGCKTAMDAADTLVTTYENQMEERAAKFMADRAMSPADEARNPMTEN